MSKVEHIKLVGGPGDGEEVTLSGKGGHVVRWEAQTEREHVALRMHGRVPSTHDPVKYRRSLRTPNLFIYQP